MKKKPRRVVPTVHACLEAVIEDARDNGVSPESLRGVYVFPIRALRQHVPDLPLDEVDVDAVREFVRDALACGYAPSTIKGKHLPLLSRCFRMEGLPNPVPEVKRRMNGALKRRTVGGPHFEIDETRDLLRRIEAYDCGQAQAIPRRRADLAVFRLVALRGLRTGELARIRIERDVDLRARTLAIFSKDAANPRVVTLSEALVEDVKALAGDRTQGPLVEGGARQLNHACEAWKRRLGEPRLNLRTLRRTCASMLDANGAPFTVIRDTLGHVRDSAQTARYLGGSRRRLLEELARLDGEVDGCEGGNVQS